MGWGSKGLLVGRPGWGVERGLPFSEIEKQKKLCYRPSSVTKWPTVKILRYAYE